VTRLSSKRTAALILGLFLIGRGTSAQTSNAARLGADERGAVIDSLASQLRRFYVRPAVAESLIAVLERRNRAGAFNGARTAESLAAQLNAAIRDAVHDDAHLAVRLTPPPPKPASGSTDDPIATRLRERAEFIREAHEESYGIPEVRTLDGNVGYIRIGEFLYQTMMGAEPFSRTAIIAAMQLVADRDALIIDLRANRGGHTTVVPLLLGYLLDRPVFGSSRSRDGQVTQHTVNVDVPGPKFGGTKPLFVLTGDSTFSAGEGIAATLKDAGRATIVGARTRGGASSGDFHSIGGGLRAFIPDTQNFGINGESLESIGVAPTVPGPAPRAFVTAYKLALEALAKAETDTARRSHLATLARASRKRSS
jgi:C-terminal processing protease CtpA/Prc